VLLPLAAISIVAMAFLKESWVQLLMLPIILLAWYDSCQPIKNDAEENKGS
jgi:hypothetical protein